MVALLVPMGTPKSVHVSGYAKVLEATYEWRRKNVKPESLPANIDKDKYYGIRKDSNAAD